MPNFRRRCEDAEWLVYQAAERERLQRNRQAGRLVFLLVLIAGMLVYIVLRHRSQARLAKALERAKKSDRMKTANC
jgi:hypothetical protein